MAEHVRWQQRFSNDQRTLAQLESYLEPPGLNEGDQQGVIKAFENTFERGWNTPNDLCAARATPHCLDPGTPWGRHSALDWLMKANPKC